LIWDLAEYVVIDSLGIYGRYFEDGSTGPDFRFINEEGLTRLKAECPEILAAVAGPDA
jgi:hypothetical protein